MTQKIALDLRDARAEIASLERQIEEAGWRPIETAPEDGTEFLALLEEGQRVVCWEKSGIFGSSWFARSGSCGGGQLYRRDAPTHWMPLPAPPAAIRARKDDAS